MDGSPEREERRAKVLRLAMLGWTQSEIAIRLGSVSEKTGKPNRVTVSEDVGKSESGESDIRRLAEEHIGRHEIARRFNLCHTTRAGKEP